jgi:hypothetical protein
MIGEIEAPKTIIEDGTTAIELDDNELRQIMFFQDGPTASTIVNVSQCEVLRLAYSVSTFE